MLINLSNATILPDLASQTAFFDKATMIVAEIEDTLSVVNFSEVEAKEIMSISSTILGLLDKLKSYEGKVTLLTKDTVKADLLLSSKMANLASLLNEGLLELKNRSEVSKYINLLYRVLGKLESWEEASLPKKEHSYKGGDLYDGYI